MMTMHKTPGAKGADDDLWESESRFRQLFDQSEDAIIFFKPGTCSIIDLNQTAERLYGYSRAELKERGVERLCRPDERARFVRIICTVRQNTMSHLGNMIHVRRDGSEIIISLRGKMMNLRGVAITCCMFQDITERVRMEEEARDIQARLIQANKMTSLGLLVSGVAHEINNPNNFIMANAQLLAAVWQDALKILREYYEENGDYQIGGIPFSVLDEEATQLFARIIEGSRRINEIVDSLKCFARQDRSTPEREVDVNRVVTTAATILHHQLIKHTENFHLDLVENIPRVAGSSQQLEQVVINLIMNACQALPAIHCGIWVTTGHDARAGRVTITVRDEGTGIPSNISCRVLEPFFTTKLDSGGTGLGLSISQSIVKEHNGTLEFTSEAGRGTTFVVSIPALPRAGEEILP